MTDWKFADPPSLGVFTLGEIISGAVPIRRVTHDIDGDWQFLDGVDVGEREPKIVCLEDVVARDPGLVALADLPLAWEATRSGPADAWKREPCFPRDWEELVDMANEYAQEQQDKLTAEFRMGEWERYDYDQETASFTWSSGGVPRVRADMRLLGSLSLKTNTWLWSWANDSVLEKARGNVDWLEQYGRENGFERLATAQWAAEEVDAWEIAAVACLLLQAEGIYRSPHEHQRTFMLLSDIQWVEGAAS